MDVGYFMIFSNYGWDGQPDGVTWKEELKLCDIAADLGFDCLWSAEHHFADYSFVPDNLQLMTHLAAKYPHIDVGTAAVILPWHDPLRVAEQVVMLDLLSEGRLRFGVGRGLARREFEAFRLSMDESRQRFDEASAMIINALETGFIEGDGPDVPPAPHRNPPAPAALDEGPALLGRDQRGVGGFGGQARRRAHGHVRRPAVGAARAGDRPRPRIAPEIPRRPPPRRRC